MKLPTNQIQIQVIDLFHVTQSVTCQYGIGMEHGIGRVRIFAGVNG